MTEKDLPSADDVRGILKDYVPQHNDGERWKVAFCECGKPYGDLTGACYAPRGSEGHTTFHDREMVPASRADALAEAVGTERVEQLVAEALDALEASGWVVPLHVRECLPGDIARALSAPEEGNK